MADISKIKVPSGTTYDIKDSVARGGLVYYITGNSTDSAGIWTGTDSRITSYYDGLTIIFVPAVAGLSSGTTLNINGLGARTCHTTNSTVLTTHYTAGTPILFTYCDGYWKRADYNSNTTYSNMSQTEASTGTATTARSISAKVLNTTINEKIDAIEGTSPISISDKTISHNDSGVIVGSYGDTSAQTPAFGGTFKALQGTVDAKGHLTAFSEHNVTIPSAVATTTTNGLMSAADKIKLDAIEGDATVAVSHTWYGTSSTAAGTVAKVVTCSNYQLAAGNIIVVLFSTANTAAAPTLNVNDTGAVAIYVGSAVANGTTNVCKWSANTLVYFMYDGTYYRYLNQTPGASNSWYGTSSTAAGTNTKTVTCANFRLQAGAIISITFTTANTASTLYLNVNGTNAKAIYVNNAVTSASNLLTWNAGEQMTFIYSGSYYFLVARSRPIEQSSTTFTDSSGVVRTITKQGNRVHMSWGDNYTTTAGSWLSIGTIPEGYRPAAQERRTLNLYTDLNTWPGRGLVEISTEGVMRCGGSYTGTAVWEIAFDYDVTIP